MPRLGESLKKYRLCKKRHSLGKECLLLIAGNAIGTSTVVFILFLCHCLTENGNGDAVMGVWVETKNFNGTDEADVFMCERYDATVECTGD